MFTSTALGGCLVRCKALTSALYFARCLYCLSLNGSLLSSFFLEIRHLVCMFQTKSLPLCPYRLDTRSALAFAPPCMAATMQGFFVANFPKNAFLIRFQPCGLSLSLVYAKVRLFPEISKYFCVFLALQNVKNQRFKCLILAHYTYTITRAHKRPSRGSCALQIVPVDYPTANKTKTPENALFCLEAKRRLTP